MGQARLALHAQMQRQYYIDDDLKIIIIIIINNILITFNECKVLYYDSLIMFLASTSDIKTIL